MMHDRNIVTNTDVYIYIFCCISYWPRMLINILWPPLGANKDGGSIWGTGSMFSCRAKNCGTGLGFCRQKPVSATRGLNQFKPAETWFKPAKTVKCSYQSYDIFPVYMSLAICTKLYFNSKIQIDIAMAIC